MRAGCRRTPQRPDRPLLLQPERRVQPGRGDGRPGARPGQPGGAGADERGPDQPPRPLLRARSADRGDRRHDRPALADLGGDRLQRERPLHHRARDPSGRELRLRPPLRRGDAQPEGLDGQTIPAPEGFRYYRDQLASTQGPINAQRPRFESIFNTLRGAGIRRSNLYLAWDFTVATDENIAARELHIRDDALATLGDTTPGNGTMDGSAPSFTVGHGRIRIRRPTSPGGCGAPTPSPATCSRAARPAAPSTSGPTGCRSATATGLRTSTASFPAAPWTSARRPGARRSTGTASSAAPRRSSTPTSSSSSPTPTTSSSARPTRSACPAATSPTRRGSSPTCRSSRSWPIASSRACSMRSSSAG